MTGTAKTLHLPWHQAKQYWLCILPKEGSVPPAVAQQLKDLGMQEVREGSETAYMMLSQRRWAETWQSIYQVLVYLNALSLVDAAVLPGDEPLEPNEVEASRKSCAAVQAIAESLW